MRMIDSPFSILHSIGIFGSSSITDSGEFGSAPWRNIHHVTARYIAPEFTYASLSLRASNRATVLLPDAAGPSIAITTPLRTGTAFHIASWDGSAPITGI